MFGVFFRKKTGREITDTDSMEDLQKTLSQTPIGYDEYKSSIVCRRGSVYDIGSYDDIDKELKIYIPDSD